MSLNSSGLAPVATGNGKARKSDQLDGSITSAENTKFGITTQPLDWRAHIPVHPAANKFPLLSGKELKELGGDIKRNGLQVDITLWRPDDKTTPVLLDGRNRMDALALIGQLALNGASELCIKGFDDSLLHVTSSPRFPIITGGDPETYVYSLNVHRRHLTPEKKRELIAAQIKADPSKSDLQIAKTVKASPTTVGTVRAKMEAKGDVSKLETRTDTKGRKQPAKKKTVRKQSAKKKTAKKKTAKKKTAKPKRSASQDQRELEAKQAHIDDLEAAREHDQGLAERLRAAEMKIVGLEGEICDLKDENAALKTENSALREKLEAAQEVAARGLGIDDGEGSS